jgi:hypothetical protein
MEDIEEDDTEKEDSQVRLQVSMAADGHFFRRTCPNCDLDFKTEVEDAQLSWLLAEEVRRQDPDAGLSGTEAAESSLICPYCKNVFSWKESFTEETIEYAKRIVFRDFVLPMLDRTFGDLADQNSRAQRSGGFLSVSVRFTYDRPPRPPRPFHGPEPPDMKIVKFLCCDRKAKVLHGWISVSSCIYCQTLVTLL